MGKLPKKIIIVNMVCNASAHPQLNCCQDLVDFQEKEKIKAWFDKVLIFQMFVGIFSTLFKGY